MLSAKSFASFLLAFGTLLFSVVIPLTAYAATEVTISSSGNSSITINGQKVTSQNTADVRSTTTIHTSDEDQVLSPVPKNEIEVTPEPTKPTAIQSQRITSPSPTPRLRRKRTPTPTPTKKPTPTATLTKKPTLTPTPIAGSSATEEKKTYIMNAINAYRKSQGLTAVKTDPYTCGFAKTRALEITKGFNHDDFRSRITNDTLPYPSYHLVTENIAMTSNYKKVVNLWINSPSHAENMRRDTPYVCVESSGNYYAYEGWRP